MKILRIIRKVLGKLTDILDMGREQGWWDKKKLVIIALFLASTAIGADMSKVDIVQGNLDALASRGGQVAGLIDENSPKEAQYLNVMAYNKFVVAEEELGLCKELKDADVYCERAQKDIDDANNDLTRCLAVIHADKAI